MLKTFTLLLACLLGMHTLFAQTPTISINTSQIQWKACVDAPFSVPVVVSGGFSSDNKFSIQVRDSGSEKEIAVLPAVLSGNSLTFSFKDASRYPNPSVQFRVLSSAPKTQSAWTPYGFNVYNKGSLILSTKVKADTLNEFDQLTILLRCFSTSYVQATLNDSTRLQFYGSPDEINSVHNITVTEQQAYTIAHAENGCGAMDVSGQVKVVINKPSLKTISIMPNSVCEGSEVKVSFSTSGPALPAQTRFKVRFNDEKGFFVDVPAERNDNYVVAKFPDSFGLSFASEFTASILTENPALVDNASRVRFMVWPQPQAIFNSQSFTASVGEPVSLQMILQGIPPITVELNDGSKQTLNYPGTTGFTLFPYQTTTYSVKSVKTGCQNPAYTGNQEVEVKMNPGIKFAVNQAANVICAGSKGSVQFQSNVEFTDATQFWIEATNDNTAEKLRFPATRSGDKLEFVVPQRAEGYANMGFNIVTNSPNLVSPKVYNIQIQTVPDILYFNDNNNVFDKPTNVRLNYQLRGGGPYMVEQPDGSKLNVSGDYGPVFELYLKQDLDFQLKSVSNTCFRNEKTAVQPLRIVTTTATGLFLEPVKRIICSGDSVEVTFGKTGNFSIGNKYLVQLSKDCCNFETIGIVTAPGTYKFRVNSDLAAREASIRIASTNPVVFSQSQRLDVQTKPESISLYPQGTENDPAVIYSYQLPGYINFNSQNGAAKSIVYTENGILKTFIPEDYNSTSIPLNPVIGKVNAFEIKSVSNACGTFPVNLKTYTLPMPYEMSIEGSGFNNTVCAGFPLSVAVQVGDVNATFSLQIAKSGTKDYVTLLSGEKSRFLQTTLPAKTAAGSYHLRAVSSDGVSTAPLNIMVSATPTATISSGEQSGIINVDSGNQITLKSKLTGGGMYTLVYEDNSVQNMYDSEGTRWVTPVKSGQYFIKSVSNTCGFGTATGSVTVKVKPVLTFNINASTICEGGTINATYKLGGDVDLSNDYIRFELADKNTNTRIQLDSTRILSGSRILKLPATLPASGYHILCFVSKYNLSSTYYMNVGQKAEVVISGNTVINAGEKAKIQLLTLKGNYESTTYMLSDGTQGDLYGYPGAIDYITVMPTVTTNYTITTLANVCGAGSATGTATVEVNPASQRSVTVTGIQDFMQNGTCAGDTILVTYKTKGTFTAANKMTVQISDPTGKNFRNLVTIGNVSPLRAILPSDVTEGSQYRVRTAASDPSTGAGAFEDFVSVMRRARARFATENIVFDETSNPKLTVLLEGSSPWKFRVGLDLGFQEFNSTEPKQVIEMYQASPDVYYRLFSVQNACGAGTIDKPSIVHSKMVIGPDVPPLPVTLASFLAKKEKSTALLVWTTASESRSDHFEVQHSTDGKSWNTVTNVSASGESSDSVNYGYVHESPVLGSENLYRLKMVDTDGSYTFSKIKSLTFDVDVSLVMFPNPVSETLTIQYQDWKKVKNVQLLNSSAVSVYDSGNNPVVHVDVRKLQPGLYFLKMTKGDKTTLVQKIIIAR